MPSRYFLVVGTKFSRGVPEVLHAYGRVIHARGLAEASQILVRARRSLTGMFVEVTLDDGSGFSVVERARALQMDLPSVMLTPNHGDPLARDVNHAFRLRTSCISAPPWAYLVNLSAERWTKAAAEDDASDEQFIDEQVSAGEDREELLSDIESILEKTGARTLAQLRRRAMDEACEQESARKQKPKGIRRLLRLSSLIPRWWHAVRGLGRATP